MGGKKEKKMIILFDCEKEVNTNYLIINDFLFDSHFENIIYNIKWKLNEYNI